MHSPLSAYETGGKLPSLTPAIKFGAPRSARTFVSPSSGARYAISAIEAMIGAHDRNCTCTTLRPQRSQHCVSAVSPRGQIGACSRIRTGKTAFLRRRCLPIASSRRNGAPHRIRTCTDRGLKPVPLPVELLARIGSPGKSRTCTPQCRRPRAVVRRRGN